MLVFAFDRDWTVDVNPHPNREAIPLEWVRELAHGTEHAVYAIGNQDLAAEAAVPGVVDVVGMHPDDWDEWLGGKRPDGRYERFPERRERLALVADLHPEADGYVVVDDLDLSDVEGWDHYHAWEFVPAVERGEVDPSLPWVREPVADGGHPPAAGVVPVDAEHLDDWLTDWGHAPGFEVSYTEDGSEHTVIVRDLSFVGATLERPSRVPVVRCRPAARDAAPFELPADDIDRVDTVRPPMDASIPETDDPVERASLLADLAAENPFAVDVSRVLTLLDRESDAPQADALDALRAVAAVRPGECTPAVPILRSLLEGECAAPEHALAVLEAVGERDAGDIVPLSAVVEPYLTAADPAVQRQAAACLSKISREAPEETVDAVPALVTLLEDRTATDHAAYNLSLVAAESPGAVEPAAPALAELVTDEAVAANPRLSATAALGRVVGEYPSAAIGIVDDVAALLEADDAKLRSNAAGLLGDVAAVHGDLVEPHVAAIADVLSAADEYARSNAVTALARVAEDYPETVAEYADEVRSLLTDDHPRTRENACWALGYLRDPMALAFLRTVAVDDENEAVRTRAQWAVARIERTQ